MCPIGGVVRNTCGAHTMGDRIFKDINNYHVRYFKIKLFLFYLCDQYFILTGWRVV